MRTLILPILLLLCALARAQSPSDPADASSSAADATINATDTAAGAADAASSAAGQAAKATPAPAPAPAPATAAAPIKLGPVTFTASLRVRLYFWDWFQPPTGDNEYQYPGNILRLNFAQKLKAWDWGAEIAVPFMFALPTGATLAAPQGSLGLGGNYYGANNNNRYPALAYPGQLFLRLDGNEGQSLQLGRFHFAEGTEMTPKNPILATVKSSRIPERLLGNFFFAEPGRSFDGLHYVFSRPSDNITIVGAVPTRGLFQVDGWGWLQVAFGYAAYTHDWGHGKHAADTRFFFIEYGDWRGVLKTDDRPAAVRRADTESIRIETYGGHSVHTIETSAGTVDLLGWIAVQTGRWGTQKQRAYQFVLESGWQPKILPKVKPWLRFGFRDGSGDDKANDNTHGTFVELLSTPRLYARTPFFNGMNIHDLYGHLILRPHAKITVSSEFHSLRLANATDLWYSGGGAYQPWSFGFTGRNTSGRRSLANFYDMNLEYRTNRHLTLTAYFGYMQGLAAMQFIYPTDKDGKFGMLESLIRF